MGAGLYIDDISVSIRDNEILHHITMPVRQNEITAIIGMSGCGKTTLLKTINRSIEKPMVTVKGDIRIGEQSIFLRPQQEVRQRIGLIFQKATPFPFSIYKNMTYAMEYEGIHTKTEQREIVVDCLRKVGLYNEVLNQLDGDACNLSGGQQQRLCIARALTVKPEVLLLDEPCSSLDIKNMLKVEQTLQAIKEDCTVIIVTHNLSQAKRIADDTVYMENGAVLEYNDTASLFNQARDARTREYINYIQ